MRPDSTKQPIIVIRWSAFFRARAIEGIHAGVPDKVGDSWSRFGKIFSADSLRWKWNCFGVSDVVDLAQIAVVSKGIVGSMWSNYMR